MLIQYKNEIVSYKFLKVMAVIKCIFISFVTAPKLFFTYQTGSVIPALMSRTPPSPPSSSLSVPQRLIALVYTLDVTMFSNSKLSADNDL